MHLAVMGQRSIVFRTTEIGNKTIVEKAQSRFEKSLTVDTLSISSSLKKIQQDFFAQGFLITTIDSMPVSGNLQTIWWSIGKVYSLVQLRMKSETAVMLSQSGLRTGNFEGQPFCPASYSRLTTNLLRP